ncbi:hypothetical protein LAZ67_8000966 [Cordylochernes scorpioides]|uniref:Uncharacterized protein n=1 Tax=Cordylochernes scorpioides TaxID=51811 RepID=A0ABY6KQB9_9ARAC|nr:hypothetical protein LAZ67_8000966 [Cordylochernes scorpioides]
MWLDHREVAFGSILDSGLVLSRLHLYTPQSPELCNLEGARWEMVRLSGVLGESWHTVVTSPLKADPVSERYSFKPQTNAGLSAKFDFQNEFSNEMKETANYVNSPTGGNYANSAAPHDFTT